MMTNRINVFNELSDNNELIKNTEKILDIDNLKIESWDIYDRK